MFAKDDPKINVKEVEDENNINLLLSDHTPDYSDFKIETLKSKTMLKFWTAPALELNPKCQKSVSKSTSASEAMFNLEKAIKDFFSGTFKMGTMILCIFRLVIVFLSALYAMLMVTPGGMCKRVCA